MSELVYLDTSVVVAYYVPEPTSSRVQALYAASDHPVISELVDVEFIAALSLRCRTGDLDRRMARRIVTLFDEHLDAGLYGRLHLQPDHYRWARNVIARFDLLLKAPDALHLAAAHIDGHRLTTADRQLARNAEVLNVSFDLIEP